MSMGRGVWCYEQSASDDRNDWLWERGITAFSTACLDEKARLLENGWGKIEGHPNPRLYSGNIAVDGFSKGITGLYAARGWTAVQTDLDGGLKRWYCVCGISVIGGSRSREP